VYPFLHTQNITNLYNNNIVIAIDGHSSCGKSTFAKQIALKLGYIYIDSGAMYRAITLACIQQNLIANGKVNLEQLPNLLQHTEVSFISKTDSTGWITLLNGADVEEEIRTLKVSENVSLVAAIPMVREKMVEQQQQMGKNKGIVMDGRDIGTVVFPNAELKIFMTAQPEIRAQRRLKEMEDKGQKVSFHEVLANILERDRIDQSRKVSPLRQASDAIILDNSNLTVSQQMEWVMELIETKLKENRKV